MARVLGRAEDMHGFDAKCTLAVAVARMQLWWNQRDLGAGTTIFVNRVRGKLPKISLAGEGVGVQCLYSISYVNVEPRSMDFTACCRFAPRRYQTASGAFFALWSLV
jgi:hypothetical protein